MGMHTQATDWEFAGLSSFGAGAGLAGGAYMFTFRSAAASVRARVFFLGGGLGVGASVGVDLPIPDSAGRVPFSPIRCSNAFSLADLNMSGGRLMSAGVSAVVGCGSMYIAAMNVRTGVLFDNAGGFGVSVGSIAIGANALAGIWQVGRILP